MLKQPNKEQGAEGINMKRKRKKNYEDSNLQGHNQQDKGLDIYFL